VRDWRSRRANTRGEPVEEHSQTFVIQPRRRFDDLGHDPVIARIHDTGE
jgi:hypothetical protein